MPHSPTSGEFSLRLNQFTIHHRTRTSNGTKLLAPNTSIREYFSSMDFGKLLLGSKDNYGKDN